MPRAFLRLSTSASAALLIAGCCANHTTEYRTFEGARDQVEGFRVTSGIGGRFVSNGDTTVYGPPYTLHFSVRADTPTAGSVVVEEAKLLAGDRVVYSTTGLTEDFRPYSEGGSWAPFDLGQPEIAHTDHVLDVRFRIQVNGGVKTGHVALLQRATSRTKRSNSYWDGVMGI